MRIRLPFAGVFFLLLLAAGYLGLTSLQVDALVNDKALHLGTFFALTVAFYWIVDTNRRRTLNLTLAVCTAALGVGSELLQAVLPNGRDFDAYDVVANVVGSLAGAGLCSWYHKRMLERRRLRKHYDAVPGEDEDGDGGEGDLELGEGVGIGAGAAGRDHEEGITEAGADAVVVGGPTTTTTTTTTKAIGATTLEDEVDNWDENAVDAWDEDDTGDLGDSTTTPKTEDSDGKEDIKKRAD